MNPAYWAMVIATIGIILLNAMAAEPPQVLSGKSDTKPVTQKFDRTKWKLAWRDEFNSGPVPDPKKWSYEEGYLRNGEAQYYTKNRRENARVEKGNLVIEALKDNY